MLLYQAFQLTVRSHFRLPGFKQLEHAQDADIEIVREKVPNHLEQRNDNAICWQANAEDILISLPDIARIRISKGKKVSIWSLDNNKHCAISLFLINQVLPLALMQRGYSVLHAAVIGIQGKAVAIAGHSGAGKSVLCAHLDQLSYPILSDESCVLLNLPDMQFTAFSGSEHLQLWKDCFYKPAFRERKGEPVRKGVKKYFYHTKTAKPLSLALDGIVILNNAYQSINTPHQLTEKQAFINLLEHSLHAHHLKGTLLSKQVFETCANIAHSLPVFELNRPESLESLAHIDQHITPLFQ